MVYGSGKRCSAATGGGSNCPGAHMDRHPRRLPVFLKLAQIRFPIGAIASIAHRVSGVLLFIALPVVAVLLDTSLRDEAGFASVRDLISSPLAVVAAGVLVWALVHHVLAGIRHLLMDVGIGGELERARASARLVLIAAPALAVFLLFWGLS
ncbi:MAG TPA: succinate dehydrogenase, cytochrome b556 subunit [Thauera sp.]|jgi:succinate dehydrogenase / fumarate reductase cytochrome b subunit|uniref:succinate dehydrogenase, cytochrome b556 subunit n=2 Tax=Zoogloeaceae TaxID=2008794 RepID=UPI00261BFD98|nr:succinate dehydrogenase, cytochrome b556 subunit [Thauera sp.]HPE03145.1 succinate dehydrogenase, cytochrome b556 subunit [Thauera sp.]HRV76564.1 succinate dehydrogenase, cytochrome b556 subunit [Thauera sp.]